MSSADRAHAQIPANKLYINIADISGSIYDGTVDGQGDLVVASWAATVPALRTAGAAVLRDMGKYIYLPAPGTATQSIILRKVQLVPAGGMGTDGTDADGYYTGYIALGGQTYGGGDGVATKVARLN